MNKHYLLFFLFLLALSACNEQYESDIRGTQGRISTNADFLKLIGDSTDIGGKLEVYSNDSDVKIKWNVTPSCNIDTSQTALSIKNGHGVLSIKWLEKSEGGNYGPDGIAYKAGVSLSCGDESRYIPLIWADKIDSTKIEESIISTRSVDSPLPRVAQITLIPTTVYLNYQNGGSMYVGLNETSFAVIDLSEITPEMNIDVSSIPTYITESTALNFRWKAGGAPSFDFTANIIFMSEGISQIGAISYTASSSNPVWQFVNCVPAENSDLPASGASIDVTSYTNQAWYISSLSGTPNTIKGDASPLGNKTLRINLVDNITSLARPVSVGVYYNNILQRTLTFNQLPNYNSDTNLDSAGDGTNCFMVTNSDRYYRFTPSLNYGNGNFTSGMAQANGTPVSAKLLWQDARSLIQDVQFVNNQIRFKVNGISGNALIAALNSNNEVVWSWHIWVTNYDPNSGGLITTNDGQLAMNRNLGAIQAASRQYSQESGAYGLYYQWGRKNPFLVKHQDYSPLYDINNNRVYWPTSPTSTSAARTVSHPMEFKNIGSGNGIAGGTTGTLASCPNRTWWGVNSNKTAYDPCPQGYRVMRQAAGGAVVTQSRLLVPQAGRLQCTSISGAAYPIQGPDCIGGLDLVYGGVAMIWLNDMTPTNNIGGSSDQIATYGYAMHIDYGKTVRCVKE